MKWFWQLSILMAVVFLHQCTASGIQLEAMPTPEISHLSPPQKAELENAQARVQALAQGSPEEQGRAWSKLARCMHGLDLRNEAVVCYQNALKFSPEDASLHYLLGILLQEMALPEEALQYFQKTAVLEPDYIPNLLAIGEFHLRQTDYSEASKAFSQVLSLEPDQVVALAGFATLTLEQQEYDRALHWAQKGIELAPHVQRLHYLAAMALRNLGQNQASEEAFKKSQQVQGKMPLNDPYYQEVQRMTQRHQVLVNEALEAASQKQWDQAEALLVKACEWQPRSAIAIYQLGRIQHQRGKYAEALETLQRALLAGPKKAPIHLQLAETLARLGQPEQAMKAFEKAISLDTNTANYFLRAGNHARKQRWFPQALELYQQGVQHLPQNWHLQMGFVICLIQQEQHYKAKSQLETLLERPGTPPPFFLLLARLLAASPDGDVRNGPRAVQMVEGLVKTGVHIDLLETGAMAMAEVGEFAKALEWQDGAIQLLGKSLQRQDLTRLRKRKALYEQNKPCRQPFEANDPIFTKPL